MKRRVRLHRRWRPRTSVCRGGAGHAPLAARGEAAAAAATQSRAGDFLDQDRGLHAEDLGQGGISAQGNVIVDARRVHHAVVRQHDPLLQIVEGNLFGRAGGLRRPSPYKSLSTSAPPSAVLTRISAASLAAHPLVEHVARVNHHDRPSLAETVAAGALRLDDDVMVLLGGQFYKACQHLAGALRRAAGADTDPHVRLPRVTAVQQPRRYSASSPALSSLAVVTSTYCSRCLARP